MNEEGVEAMDDVGSGARLSATEKGKQKADAADLPSAGAGVLRAAPAPGPTTEIEEAPPSPPPLSSGLLAVSQLQRNLGEGSSSKPLEGELWSGNEATWHAGAGVPRHPLGPSACTEIEEAPPSPPPQSRLFPLNAAAPAGLGGLADELERNEVALALLRIRLQELRRERGEGASERPESAAAAAAGIQMAEDKLGAMEESLNIWRDRMVALRVQAEEMQALRESVEEFWMPVPVPQRKNSKIRGICNWKRIVPVVALTSWLVLLVLFRTMLPLHYLTHIVGAIAVLWILGSIAFCRRLIGPSRTTKGFSIHFARFMCVCFLILVLYALYLILRLVGGTFAGWFGKHP